MRACVIWRRERRHGGGSEGGEGRRGRGGEEEGGGGGREKRGKVGRKRLEWGGNLSVKRYILETGELRMQATQKNRPWPLRSIGRLAARLDMRWRYIPHRYTMLRRTADGAGPSSCSTLYIYIPPYTRSRRP